MIYKFLKQIIKLALFFFFRKIIVTGKEHIPKVGPIILVANHPNTLMDPLIIASLTDQKIGFVANASIFVNRLATRIFNYFHVIPIYRKKDIETVEKLDNRASFLKCHEYFESKGSLLIFPEGTSHYELKLREIKTGTARIALSYENEKKFKGALRIVPIALDYSDAIQFRSIVSVTVCPEILLSTYEEIFYEDEVAAVIELTGAIQRELSEIIPQTSDKEQEKFLVQAHQFYTLYYSSNAESSKDEGDFLQLRNEVSKALKFLHKNNSALYLNMKHKLYDFYDLLKKENLSPYVLPDKELKYSNYVFDFLNIIKFIFLFPIYLLGLVCNYIPYKLVAQVFKGLKLDIEYRAAVQMILGIFVFPLYYVIIFWAFSNKVSDNIWLQIGFLLIMPISGYISLYFFTQFKRFFEQLRFDIQLSSEKKNAILDVQSEILGLIKDARQLYLRQEID